MEGLFFLLFGLAFFFPVLDLVARIIALVIGIMWVVGAVRSK